MVVARKESCPLNLQAHVAPIELLPAVATGLSCSGACTRHHTGIVLCLSVRPNLCRGNVVSQYNVSNRKPITAVTQRERFRVVTT
jgi:hypothetical protein